MDRYQLAQDHLMKVGFGKTNYTNLVMVAEAIERGVTVERSSSGRRIILRKGRKTARWRGGNSNLNSSLAHKTANLKDISSRVLRHAGVNAPENSTFLGTEAVRAWHWAEPFAKVVIKPHNGKQGRDVYAGIQDREEFFDAFEQVSRKHPQVLVEEFHTGIEHRCLVVDNTLVAVTTRRPANVMGDGRSTVEELVDYKNADRGRIHKKLGLGHREQFKLSRQGLSPDSVPDSGQRIYLLDTSNIHTGGDAIDATDDLSPDEREMIESASRAIPGLRLGGFDVLIPGEQAGEDQSASIIEINANPMTSMHHFPWEGKPRNVSAPILEAMFPNITGS